MGRKSDPMTDLDRRIIAMRNDGMAWRAIGREVGLADVSVAYRYNKFSNNRKCLMCGHAFPSDGPHNRICDGCKLSDAWGRADGRVIKVAGE